MINQTVSVVVPVYRAGAGLSNVVEELLDGYVEMSVAPTVRLTLDEIVLVVDNPDLPGSERDRLVGLSELDGRVRVIWLATNYGQHPATVAGIVSTNGDWVATMDEDGQHNPTALAGMAQTAGDQGKPLVYASPTNPPPHGLWRNFASRTTKALFRGLSGTNTQFHSFRFMEGALARAACAYVGENVYLDVALSWSCGESSVCPVEMRREDSRSAYNLRRLMSHFWRMVLSSGTRALRLIAAAGVFVALIGVITAAVFASRRLSGEALPPGWTSVMVALLVLSGGTLLCLGVLAEYVGFVVRNSIGRPVYVTVEPPASRALWVLQAALLAAATPDTVRGPG